MKKKIWGHVAKSFKEAEEFDIKFWRRAGVRARFAATWKAVEEFYKARGINRSKLRLDKSVGKLVKRTHP